MPRRIHSLLSALAVALAASPAAAAEQVAVAAAANLTYVLAPVDAAFAAGHPGVAVQPTFGASGNLVALISQGAPYDVFLAADMDFPRKLVQAGGADGASLVAYAYGRLVLWTTRPTLGLSSVQAVVRDPEVRRIAVANPRTAPYGQAAEETLEKLGLSAVAGPKIVFGENVSQAAEYVGTGNADAGFVALSLVDAPGRPKLGRWIEVPARLYTPIAQGGVLTRRGAGRAAARSYLAFLSSPQARAIFARFGYRLP